MAIVGVVTVLISFVSLGVHRSLAGNLAGKDTKGVCALRTSHREIACTSVNSLASRIKDATRRLLPEHN